MTAVPTGILVGQWVALAVLATFVFVLFRQVAYLGGLASPGKASNALPEGAVAPAFWYGRYVPGEEPVGRERFEPGGAARLLLFADPWCEACEALVEALNEREWPPGMRRPLVVTDAPATRLSGVPAFRESRVEIGLVDDSVYRTLYRVEVTPMLFAIGADGSVLMSGSADSVAGLQRFIDLVAEPENRPGTPVVVTTHGT